jgi:hypothetical protein
MPSSIVPCATKFTTCTFPRLPQAVNAADALLEDRRVPRHSHVDDGRGGVLKIEPDAPRVGGEEYATGRIVAETVDQARALVARNCAVKQHVLPAGCLESAADDLVRADPLTEDQGLGERLLQPLAEDAHQLVRLRAVIGLVIHEPGAVAGHAHTLQRAGEHALVGIGEKPALAPAGDDTRHDLAVLFVMCHLLRRHRHKHGVVDVGGQLREHFGLASAQHDRRERGADAVEVAIAGHAVHRSGALRAQRGWIDLDRAEPLDRRVPRAQARSSSPLRPHDLARRHSRASPQALDEGACIAGLAGCGSHLSLCGPLRDPPRPRLARQLRRAALRDRKARSCQQGLDGRWIQHRVS